MLKYKKMSLFDAPPFALLVHATNCQGLWDSGIAVEFKQRYPNSFKYYVAHCKASYNLAGSFYRCHRENEHSVVNLFTSAFDSKNPDSEEEILVNTTLALDKFLDKYWGALIYSNKFNSGRFGVEWSKTEAILKILTKRYNVNWIITDPNMPEEFDGLEIL
jgi:ADP-ribose 1''-phosphate phosphatase